MFKNMLQQSLHVRCVSNDSSLDGIGQLVVGGLEGGTSKHVRNFWLKVRGNCATAGSLLLLLDIDCALAHNCRDDASGEVFSREPGLDVASSNVYDNELFLVEENLHFVEAFLN
jgi:hypothetical protein